jgi:hypothetical protein
VAGRVGNKKTGTRVPGLGFESFDICLFVPEIFKDGSSLYEFDKRFSVA